MGKTKRSIETNRQISIICIVMLSIIMVTFIFVSIILLFSKTETNKKIEGIQTQIETISYENSEIEDEINKYVELTSNASNPSVYIDNLKKEYESILPAIEKEAKSSESDKKIVYLNFSLTSNKYLNDILETLANNHIIANFYSSNSDLYDVIIKNGHEIGLYIDENTNLETFYEDNKTMIDDYNIDLFMTSLDLNENDISITNLKHVITNSTSEGKSQLTHTAYANNIIETTADRIFLIVRINGDNSIGKDALQTIISGLKEKGYTFLPLISKSSIFD